MIRNFLAYRSFVLAAPHSFLLQRINFYPDRIVYPFPHTGCIRTVKSWQSADPQAPTVRQASFPLQGAHTAGTDFASLKHLLLLQHKRLSNKKFNVSLFAFASVLVFPKHATLDTNGIGRKVQDWVHVPGSSPCASVGAVCCRCSCVSACSTASHSSLMRSASPSTSSSEIYVVKPSGISICIPGVAGTGGAVWAA